MIVKPAHTLVALACALTCFAAQAAKITITSRDPAGVGFNDPTPAAPVGGNMGTTLGQQRMNVYRYVADIWEKNLASDINIVVSAGWEPLSCTASSAVLGSAGAWNIWHDFPNGAAGTWYPQALANKLAGTNLSAGTPDDGSGYGNADIKTQFNINLGKPDCLAGSPFYLGLDGNAGTQVNFVATLLHELGHGLGFSVMTVSTGNGRRLNAQGTAFTEAGLPSIWERHMYDNTAGKTWLDMSSAERAASAINPLKLAWIGPNAAGAAPSLLKPIGLAKASSPAPGYNRTADYIPASFGPAPKSGSTMGVLAVVAPQAGEAGPGCSAYDSANAAAVKNKVALISRGGCTFAIKAKNAQDAGASGVIVANNVAGAFTVGGSDPSIKITTIGISKDDGDAFKAAVAAAIPYGSRNKPGAVTVTLGQDPVRLSGADAARRPLLYTPNPLAPGSSVSHWDVTASPNLLMEPSINGDLTINLKPPYDLTVPLLKDLGW